MNYFPRTLSQDESTYGLQTTHILFHVVVGIIRLLTRNTSATFTTTYCQERGAHNEQQPCKWVAEQCRGSFSSMERRRWRVHTAPEAEVNQI